VPNDPCIRLLKVVDTQVPRFSATYDVNLQPETKDANGISACRPQTDKTSEDTGCYNFYGLYGPYKKGYVIDPKDMWGGVLPQFDRMLTTLAGERKPKYDATPDARKNYVIHEGATEFRDPGVLIFDLVDGIMDYSPDRQCASRVHA
jgi:hypothetical protein